VSELKPVTEYVLIEAWQYEDGGLGWRIKDLHEKDLNNEFLEDVLIEMSERQLARGHEVLISAYMRDNGLITVVRDRKMCAEDRRTYVWVKTQFMRASCNVFKETPRFEKLLRLYWSLEWFLKRLKRSQNAQQRAVGGRPLAAQDAAPEAFEPVENTVERGGNVVPFGPVGRAP
jgi:hypothetical protein